MSTPAAAPLLAIRGLRAAYGKIEALKGVDLDINSSEIVALIGANGAGKSTLMMTIFGKPRARAGQVLFDGRDITSVPTMPPAICLTAISAVWKLRARCAPNRRCSASTNPPPD